MKELSIEQKAKAYDEALEYAHYLINERCKEGTDGSFHRADLQKMFPELQESEDDMIKKEIISALKYANHKGVYDKHLAWLEKQGEQNSTDEPKFKVGDWITDGNITIQIEAIKNNCYLYCGDCVLYSTKTADKVYHLWTIQDAKDGDVLAGGEQLFLFKRMDTSNSFYAHCNYHFIGYDSLSIYDCSYSIDNIYPAAKEQRELLFSKMKEAGYEWDADKKELKKRQKHTPKHKVGDTIYYNSFGDVKSMVVADVVTDSTDNPMYEDENGNIVFEEDLIEYNTAWSEEDDNCLSTIIAEFSKCAGKSVSKDEWMRCNDFLNSLKDRVQPQSKQGCCECDEIDIQTAIEICKNAGYDLIANRLKSLSLQNRWKPSDEQMDAFERALNCYSGISPTNREDVYTLEIMREQLKKLREE